MALESLEEDSCGFQAEGSNIIFPDQFWPGPNYCFKSEEKIHLDFRDSLNF